MNPLLTLTEIEALIAARTAGTAMLALSLDLGRSTTPVNIDAQGWHVGSAHYPIPTAYKSRTIYYWDGNDFAPIQRYDGALIKLVPTEWGAPTFEIDGIKMLPTARSSPIDDAQRKVALVQPRGKRILDTCGGLGYFAQCALDGGAARIQSFEKNPDVLWLRTLNPWSPDLTAHADRLTLTHASICDAITPLPDAGFDAILHDPPRFGIAGELYSQAFYDQLARVIAPRGRLFHYTGTPNQLTSGRNLPREVSTRLQRAGFTPELALDGVLATRNPRR